MIKDKIDNIELRFNMLLNHCYIEWKTKVSKDITSILEGYMTVYDEEIPYIFILSQMIIFENIPPQNVLELYSYFFRSNVTIEMLKRCIDYITLNFNDLIEEYRKLNTTLSFYRTAIGYVTEEYQLELEQWSKSNTSYFKLVPKKITRKSIPANMDMLKILINEYKILSAEKLVDTSDLLLELLQNSKK